MWLEGFARSPAWFFFVLTLAFSAARGRADAPKPPPPALADTVWGAAQTGDVDAVKAHLAKGVDVNASDAEQRRRFTPLLYAAEAGKLEAVRFLLASGADVEKAGKSAELPLQMAAKRGHVEVVKTLLATGTHVDLYDPPSIPALCYAAWNGHGDTMATLIDRGADVGREDEHGNAPIAYAALGGHLDAVRLLLKRGARPLPHNNAGFSPLAWASDEGHLEVVKFFVAEQGADPGECNGDHSVIGMATRSGHFEVVQFLLDRGADINPVARFEEPLLALAAARGDLRMMRLLIDRGHEIGQFTGVKEAALAGHREAVALLLERGGWLGYESDTPEVLAALADKGDVDTFILLHDADRRRRGAAPVPAVLDAEHALLRAAAAGDVERVRRLVAEGKPFSADVLAAATKAAELKQNGAIVGALRPLAERAAELAKEGAKLTRKMYEASEKGDVAQMRDLLARGVDVTWCEPDSGLSFLYATATSGDVEAVRMLLDLGLKPGHMGPTGSLRDLRPLGAAAGRGHADVVRLLIERGADVNHVTAPGGTALHTAAKAGHVDVVRLLIAAKAKVDEPGYERRTALMGAAEEGHAAVVKLLLAAGADSNARDAGDATPLNIAEAHGRDVAAAVIRAAGGVRGAPAKVDLFVLLQRDVSELKGWLDRGGDPNAELEGLDANLVEQAIQMIHDEVKLRATLTLLLERGADLGRAHGLLALAAYHRRGPAVLQLLIDAGADVDEPRFTDGTTPLMTAVSHGDVAAVRTLVAGGADPALARNDKATALTLAEKHTDSRALLAALRGQAARTRPGQEP